MLDIDNLTYRIGGRDILSGASVHIPTGHKVGVVGSNGAGKTTLLKLISSELFPDAGSIRRTRQTTIGMVEQEAPSGPRTLLDYVLSSDTECSSLLSEIETATDPNRISAISQRLDEINAYAAPSRAATILAGLGFNDLEQKRALSDLSGGWRMRVALASVLFLRSDLLLLDEPTNYLDLEGTLWLEGYLRSYPHTVMLVSHDRDLLNNAVNSILHIESGQFTLYRGGYDTFEETRLKQQIQQERLRQRQEAERKHIQSYVDRFRYKANKARQAQSRLKALARMRPIVEAAMDPSLNFKFPKIKTLKSPIINLEQTAVGYGGEFPILSDLSLRIDANDRIALLGRNGNGKSTLAKLIAGRLEHSAGKIKRVTKLNIGFFSQHQIDELQANETPLDHLRVLLPDLNETKLRSRLGTFGLTQNRAETAANQLSGGERARLVLALVTVKSPHLLILDEPTNHLDVNARQALAQALNDYSGAVLLISHDRHLIELTADQLWLVTNGTVTPWDGDIEDYRRLSLKKEIPKQDSSTPDNNRLTSRQAKAAKRLRLSPLRKIAESAEDKLMHLQEEQAVITRALSDPTLYKGTPEKLAALNQQRSQIEKSIADAEAAWLAAEEALEAAQE